MAARKVMSPVKVPSGSVRAGYYSTPYGKQTAVQVNSQLRSGDITSQDVSPYKPSARERISSVSNAVPSVPGINLPNTSGYSGILMAELLLATIIVGIRAVADYVPNVDTSQPGSQNPPKGMPPLPLYASILGVYFLLSFMTNGGGRKAQFAVAFALLVDIALALNSKTEITQVSTWIDNIGKTGPASTGAYATPPVLDSASGSDTVTGGTTAASESLIQKSLQIIEKAAQNVPGAGPGVSEIVKWISSL